MDIVGIITGIGVNDTFYLQSIIFLVTYFFLIFVVLQPFHKALMARRESTQGSEEKADEIIAQTKTMREQYEGLAKTLNDKVRDIFDASRKTSNQKADEIVSNAKQSAEKLVAENRQKVAAEITTTRESLKGEVPEVSRLIVNKLIGREG